MDGKPWVIIGASRGIGLEFVKQLLESGQPVLATVRNVSAAPKLFDLIASQGAQDRCIVEQCDVSSDGSITVSPPHQSQGKSNKIRTLSTKCSNM